MCGPGPPASRPAEPAGETRVNVTGSRRRPATSTELLASSQNVHQNTFTGGPLQHDWSELNRENARRIWRAHLVDVCEELSRRSDEVGSQATRAMRAGSPDMFEDVQTGEEIRAATIANVGQFAQLVRDGTDPVGIDLPDVTIGVVHAVVQRRLGLAPLLRIYSLGHEQVWNWLFDRIAERLNQPRDLSAASELLSAWLFAYVNESTRQITEIYEEEQKYWLTSALAEQAAAVEQILEGKEREEARASRTLRHDLRRHHIGMYCWTGPGAEVVDPQGVLRQEVRRIAAAVDTEGPLVVPRGPSAVRAWLSRRRPFTADEVAALKTWTSSQGVRVAFGSTSDGLLGFRSSQIEASHAHRVAMFEDRAGAAATSYESVAVAAMSTMDMEQARRFVSRILGPLAAPDEPVVRIAETLAVYLEHGSRGRAAAHLYVHANTVSYRIRQAETMLGRDLASHTLDLRVALALLPAVRGSASSD